MHARLQTNLRTPTSIDADAIKHRAYLDQRIVVLSLDDPRLNWHERELLKQMGDRLLGARGR